MAECVQKIDSAKTACPNTALGEGPQDCPWAGVSRALVAQARGGHDVGPLLSKLLPDLDSALKSDAKRQAWKRLWGQSINFDELANGTIVDPAILQVLGEKLKIMAPLELHHIRAEKSLEGPDVVLRSQVPATLDPAGHQLAHAGMEHTYGYLFSTLKTQFGYKRARWVDGEIERGFGLTPGLLGPRPAEGTLFSNVTFFIGHIAFRNEPPKAALLGKSLKGLPSIPVALSEFRFSELKPVRLDETVEAKDLSGDVRTVILHTDLVPFSKVAQPNSHLLVYSVTDPSHGGTLLITAFPVAQGFVDMVLKADGLGEGKPVKSRYNAFVEGVSGVAGLKGTRKVLP
jgi:hypothetical protein